MPCAGDECDRDGDVVEHSNDNCPFTANPTQADADGDGVGDACDNCVADANPRVPLALLAANPWATLTGGQRDDDRDGYGNVCDAKFADTVGTIVNTLDLNQLRAATGKPRGADLCGVDGQSPCAVYDLNEAGNSVGGTDLSRFRELNLRPPGPKCAACSLACVAGTDATCAAAP
ncbi:MAG: thrombospondin type 3 repeat-containing protein [Myxococcota bacterium]